jgi:hypothetical protein
MRAQIKSVESMNKSTTLVLATSTLEMDLLPALYDALQECGNAARLDVVIYCRGGLVNAARRIALLFHTFSPRIRFIVPHYCESSGTVAALAAHEIIAGPVASFSPFDPMLQGEQSKVDDGPQALSAQDIRLFARMCRDWFGVPENEASAQTMSAMCANFFPTTLTSFYRIALETREVCNELLRLSMREQSEEVRSGIVDKLMFGYHSHTFSLTRDDLQSLGLPMRRDPAVEAVAWDIASEWRQFRVAEARKSQDEDRISSLIATRARTRLQCRHPQSSTKSWEVRDTQ